MPNPVTRQHIDTLQTLRSRLTETRLQDRARFARELDRLFSRRTLDNQFEDSVNKLGDAIEQSVMRVASLLNLSLKITYDEALPITQHHDEILQTLATQQVLVLCGATGSGKTTQLPKFCLQAGRGAFGLIGHTQPRRIAARAIANRLAEELGTTVGGAVGYQVRFNDRTGPDCRVKLMTDGILLKEMESDPELRRYDTLIIDEAHERSLNIDLLLGVLRGLLKKRHDLKLIVTSATIDPEKFSKFFDDAPIIEVSGRSYPVEVLYRPLTDEAEDAAELSLPEGVVAAVRELDNAAHGQRGDVLVFLPGEKQIRECDAELTRAKFGNTEILPLYSRLSSADQEKIFSKHSARRVVLATNVAETSLTVPGIRNVIDSGLARISRYSVRGKVQRLPIEKIAQANAEQRKGRCGRESPGICIRLFGEEDFIARDAFTSPEVLRTNLASVILRLAVLRLGDPGDFPFLDPPDTRAINDGYRLLQELKAVDDERRVTSLGKQIAALPVDPRLARMLLAASQHRCLAEMLIVAAFLEIQDPRERPSDAQQAADLAHAQFLDARSDFIAVLNLWKSFHEQANDLSGSQLRKWCRDKFLSFVRMREWQELHRQLRDNVEELELKKNQAPADYADLHQAILTGFLGNIGVLEEKREYLGARSMRFVIAPGSPLATKPPRWVVAGSLLETTRVFARMVASVETPWIESAAAHLLKRSYSEPHWVEQKGFVTAFESLALYGLVLAAERRVNYGSVAPKAAREIFVREALVSGRAVIRAEFLEHNRKMREQVESLEAKIRRRDVVLTEQAQCDWYLARLPEHINSVATLDKWLKEMRHSPHEMQSHAQLLLMQREDLMSRDVPEASAAEFPDCITVATNELQLTYKFEPDEADDGVTLSIPEPLLSELDATQLSWVIPGWRLERIVAILRALPKEQRKHFVPVPDAASRCNLFLSGSTYSDGKLADWITKESAIPTTAEALARVPIPEYLQLNVRVVSLDGKTFRQSRSLIVLRRELRASPLSTIQTAAITNNIYKEWEFGELPVEKEVERQGVKFRVYPAIAPRAEGVVFAEFGSLAEAAASMRLGLLRLCMISLPHQVKYARQQFNARKELLLLSQSLRLSRPLVESFVERVFLDCFLADGNLPRSRMEFEQLLETNRANVSSVADKLSATLLDILQTARTIHQQVTKLSTTANPWAREVDEQLRALLPNDFFMHTPLPWLTHLPRYLRAIIRRIEKAPGNARRDQELSKSLAPFVEAYAQLAKQAGIAKPAELIQLRWMIEEYRVSLFAQDLKTSIPVSDKRLAEQVQHARKEVAR